MYYIRFGKIPEREQSEIYQHNKRIGFEKGISVYDACYLRNKWNIVLPSKLSTDTLDTYKKFRFYSKSKVYLVTGEEVGIGNDNEPLLKNVEIIEDITDMFY